MELLVAVGLLIILHQVCALVPQIDVLAVQVLEIVSLLLLLPINPTRNKLRL